MCVCVRGVCDCDCDCPSSITRTHGGAMKTISVTKVNWLKILSRPVSVCPINCFFLLLEVDKAFFLYGMDVQLKI